MGGCICWPAAASAQLVRDLQATPRVTVEIGDETRFGTARVLVAGILEDQLARELLVSEYASSERDLIEWGRSSLPVVIVLSSTAT
jgi:hypothetical protein